MIRVQRRLAERVLFVSNIRKNFTFLKETAIRVLLCKMWVNFCLSKVFCTVWQCGWVWVHLHLGKFEVPFWGVGIFLLL